MNILYIAQYFNLPSEAGASRHYAFSTELRKKGHRVTVISGCQNYRTGLVPQHCRGRLFTREDVDGVEVIKTWVYSDYRGSFKKRLLNFFSFMFMAVWAGLRVKDTDIVFASSTPLFVGASGYTLSRLKNIPFIFDVRDLWPEAAVDLGVLKNKTIIRVSGALARFLYRKAALVTTVSGGFLQGILKQGIPEHKVALLPNGVDLNIYDRIDKEQSRGLRRRLGLEDKFMCIYIGAFGIVNSLTTVLEAARELQEHKEIAFLLVGGGDQKERLQGLRREWGLENVQILDPVPKEEVPLYLAMADACILTLRKEGFFGGMLPNKIFDYLASATPVIAAAHGDSIDLIEKAGAGLSTGPGDYRTVARHIVRLRGMPPAERKAMGERGRKYVLEHYQRADLAEKLARLMEEVKNGK